MECGCGHLPRAALALALGYVLEPIRARGRHEIQISSVFCGFVKFHPKPQTQRPADSFQQLQGMAVVIGVFDPRYNGLTSADSVGEFLLASAGILASLIDLHSNINLKGLLLGGLG
jgi:hypothetical protein